MVAESLGGVHEAAQAHIISKLGTALALHTGQADGEHCGLKGVKTQKKFIESKIGGIFSGITSRVTTKNLKIGLRGNYDLEPFLSFFARFHLFLGWFGTPSSQYKVPLILVRDQRNLLRPFGSPKK